MTDRTEPHSPPAARGRADEDHQDMPKEAQP